VLEGKEIWLDGEMADLGSGGRELLLLLLLLGRGALL
jgi:hypothetical protein